MTFLAPGFLIAAGLAALVIIGLHFLSTREPKLEVLPTTRFLPDLPVRATATALRPTDPWLLLLRVSLVLLAGAALARPVFLPARDTVARIVAVDVSRAVGDVAELADSADRYWPGAAAVILFDSAAYEAGDGAAGVQAARDRLRALAGLGAEAGAERRRTTGSSSRAPARRGVPPRVEDPAAGGATPWPHGTGSRGSLSASLLAARRAAARVRDRADSLELVVVSPFVAEEYDAATGRIRGLWPGRVKTVSVTAATTGERGDSIRIEWADSVAGDVFGSSGDAAGTRVGDTAYSQYWTAREPPDTVAAVRAGDAVLVYPFVRRWDVAASDDPAVRIIARWADGEPAAIERPLGGSAASERPSAGAEGCVRSFGFSLPAEGDALFRSEFQRFLAGLTAPCGEPRDFAPLPASVMASLAGEGALAATAAIDRRVERVTPLTPWLLLAVMLLALLERVVRRGGGRAGRAAGGASGSAESRASAA